MTPHGITTGATEAADDMQDASTTSATETGRDDLIL
jgi:hypothetical protein